MTASQAFSSCSEPEPVQVDALTVVHLLLQMSLAVDPSPAVWRKAEREAVATARRLARDVRRKEAARDFGRRAAEPINWADNRGWGTTGRQPGTWTGD